MRLVHQTPQANGGYRVEHEDKRRHADGTGRPASPGLVHSIRPGVPCPETVLVAVMTDGSYLLVGYPQGMPAAFIVPEDAAPLRHALATAFENLTAKPVNGEGSTPGAIGVQS